MNLRMGSRHAGSLVAFALGLAFVACSGATENVGSKYVKTATIGSAGGTIPISASDSAALAGTSIAIPPNALAKDTTISIGLSALGVSPAGKTAAGPVVDFEPSGTVFASPVTITIPVTVASGTPAASVFIEAVESDGTTRALPARSLANGLATFQVSGFTLFGAWVGGADAGCSGAPNPGDLCATTADCACLANSVCVAGHCESGTTTPDAGCSGALNPGDLCATTADCACIPGTVCVSGHCGS